MTTAGLFEISQLYIFILCVWIVGQVFNLLNAQLVGEILVGIGLGPEAANWVPFPDALTLLGQVGLTFLVVEGGLSIDLNTLRKVGVRALIIAVIGTTLPVLFAWGLLACFGIPTKEGITAGTALSSTSIGMATKMLQELNLLGTPLSNIISVAAMFDDILSLVILAVLLNLVGETSSTSELLWKIFQPIVVSLAFIIIGVVLAFVTPSICNVYIGLARKHKFKKSNIDLSLYVLFLVIGAALSVAAGYAGSTSLLGAFATGVAFTSVEPVKEMWEKNVLPFEILYSLFFATIGFVIPVGRMFEKDAVGIGFLFTLPAIIGKLACGFAVKNIKKDGLVVGWAMVARGELGFVMATQAYNDGLLTERTLSIVVWALLLSTFLAPLVFGFLIKRRLKKEEKQRLDGLHESERTNYSDKMDNDENDHVADVAISSNNIDLVSESATSSLKDFPLEMSEK